MPYKNLDGQTKFCTHPNNNTSGICDECLRDLNQFKGETRLCIYCSKVLTLYQHSRLKVTHLYCTNNHCFTYGLLQVGIIKK